MPLDNRKVIEILLDETAKIEERCDGYREVISEGIADIFSYEREHAVANTDIQKRINEKCNEIGKFLSDRRDK